MRLSRIVVGCRIGSKFTNRGPGKCSITQRQGAKGNINPNRRAVRAFYWKPGFLTCSMINRLSKERVYIMWKESSAYFWNEVVQKCMRKIVGTSSEQRRSSGICPDNKAVMIDHQGRIGSAVKN